MKIKILEFVEGARKAKGITVIIDVFRAFSVACYAFDAGAARLIVTAEIEEAFKLKNQYRNCVLAGERCEKKIEGFDFGNSPTEIIKSDLRGKTVVLTTTAGTCGILNAENADMIITGSFVNAGAIIKYIKAMNPHEVSLVAMGYRKTESAIEDLLCAELIASGLKDSNEDFDMRIADLRLTGGKRFFIPDNIDFSPPTDFFLCTMANRFNFILRGERRYDANIDLAKIEVV